MAVPVNKIFNLVLDIGIAARIDLAFVPALGGDGGNFHAPDLQFPTIFLGETFRIVKTVDDGHRRLIRSLSAGLGVLHDQEGRQQLASGCSVLGQP